MKILAISGSPRKNGNTFAILNEVLKGAQQQGAEIELYSVSGKNLQPCDACGACMKTGICHIKDDIPELLDKMVAADGIVFGAPSYYYTMTAQTKIIIDRTRPLNRPERSLANKVGAVVVTGGSLGLAGILKDIYFFMITKQMLPANFVAAYALNEGDVKPLEKGLKAAGELGQQMVLIAQQNFKYPAQFRGAGFGYGTWCE
jgi:multimeric flavodoxin WrbA